MKDLPADRANDKSGVKILGAKSLRVITLLFGRSEEGVRIR